INKVEIIDTTVLLLKNENIKNEVKEIKKLEIEKKEIEKKIEVEKSEKLKLSDEKLKLEGIILVEEEKIKNDLAYQLAKDLSEDSNCPVCGSKDHPKLANPSIEIDETLLLSLKETLEKVNSKYHKLDPQKLEEELSIKVENLNTRNSIELEKVINKNTVEIDEIIGKNRSCEELKNNLEQEKNNLDLNRVKLEGILKNLKEKSVESEEVLKDENSKKLELEEGLKLLYVDFSNLDLELNELEEKYKVLKNQEVESKLYREESKEYRKKYEDKGSQKQKVDDNLNKVKTELVEVETTLILNGKINEEKKIDLLNMVENSKFSNLEVAIESSLSPENVIKYEKEIKTHSNESIKNNGLIESLKIKINNRTISSNEWEELKVEKNEMKELDGRLTRDMTSTKKDIDRMEELLKDVEDLLIESREKEVDYHLLEDMNKLFAGNAFVEYLALGKLKNITKHASKRLEKITNGRYGIGVGGDANFVICDNFNGGIKRRAATLSGGETFLVSLSLALALSNQIQLKGKVNLEFFFLDEGFGTLDSSLLDKVISSLETLKDDEKLKVGIITHVEELKERVPRKLEVLEAIPGERGSKVVMN
ncbi:MAG: hypothetical protein KAH04_05715, partial [Psychrilyobacter sp.]|nr:hypothetical protein [Psychrilyobacter sp.]